jgi:HEAT repeat protein
MRPRLLPLLIALSTLAACASTGKGSEVEAEALPAPTPEARVEPEPIGKLLVDLNASIRAWTQLSMAARTEDERRKALLLEKDLMRRTIERIDELIEELESGPPNNRVIAASAVGFTRDARVQPALLGAIEDPDPLVRSNALIGLTLLGRPDTPLEPICELLATSPDPWVRSNAAMCLSTLVAAGARESCAAETAREGLLDSEPGVRAQCALCLASLLDAESTRAIADLLSDDVPIVRHAAARALAHIGRESPTERPLAARALVRAYDQADGSARERYLAELIALSGHDFGDDPVEWQDWARRLQ